MDGRGLKFLLATIVAATGAFAAPAAQAQSADLEGPWQQIESNAGRCPTCGLAIERDGTRLVVTANNGWSATVLARGDKSDASGTGRWSPGVAGALASKPFRVNFVLQEQRLHMSMTIDMADGRRWTVKAVYARTWFGA